MLETVLFSIFVTRPDSLHRALPAEGGNSEKPRTAGHDVSTSGGVAKIENSTDRLWVVPPLPIAQGLRPYIPRDAWPDLGKEKDAGVPVQEMAKR